MENNFDDKHEKRIAFENDLLEIGTEMFQRATDPEKKTKIGEALSKFKTYLVFS